MTVRDGISFTATAGAGVDKRLERLLDMLERLRGTGSAAAGADGVQATLARAAELVDLLDAIRPELQPGATSGGWDDYDVLTARVYFEMYDRAVRELRAVAFEARGRIERAAAVVAEAREFARRQRRRAGKLAAKHVNP